MCERSLERDIIAQAGVFFLMLEKRYSGQSCFCALAISQEEVGHTYMGLGEQKAEVALDPLFSRVLAGGYLRC